MLAYFGRNFSKSSNFMHVKLIIRSFTRQNGYGFIPRADPGFFSRGVQSTSLYMRHALWKMGWKFIVCQRTRTTKWFCRPLDKVDRSTMDSTVYDGLLDVMDHRDSFNPLLSEKGSISNLLLLITLNIIPLAGLKKFLVDLTYIWHRLRICMTLSYLVKQTAIMDH